jgi:hypothetical protein
LSVSEVQIARIIGGHLLRDDPRIAFEAATPIAGDDWAWTDDNAKIVQFLSRPGLGAEPAQDRRDCLDFVLRMVDGPFVFRKVARPRLEPATEPGRWVHALWDIQGDATDLRLGPRFHDGRDCWALRLSGHEIRVRAGRGKWRILLRDLWSAPAWAQDGQTLFLSASADVVLPHTFGSAPLGVVRLTHSLHAARATIETRMEIELHARARVDEVELMVGQSDMSHGHGNVRYQRLHVAGPGQEITTQDIALAKAGSNEATGRDFVMAAQRDTQRGFANAVHILSQTATLHRVEWSARSDIAALDRCATLHGFAWPQGGTTLRVRETRFLTSGGLYDEVASYRSFLVADAAAMPARFVLDRSISYDYGVEVDALAKAFALAKAEGHGESGALLEAAETLLATYMRHFVARQRDGEDAVFSRQLAFVTLGAVTLLRATGSQAHRDTLATLVDTLLGFGRPFVLPEGRPGRAFLMGRASNREAYADCHSAALFALAAAAPHLDDPRIAEALRDGIACFALGSTDLDLGGGPVRIDSVHVRWLDDHERLRDNPAPWTYQAALSLRLLRRLALSTDPVLRAAADLHRDRLPVLLSVLTEQLRRALRARTPDEVEFLSSAASSETNSETQPWVGLALFDHPFD